MPQEPTNAQLDALIRGCAQSDWEKVEAVVARVGELCEAQKLRFDPDVVATRIATLVQDGNLEGLGDLTRWKRGEVRLLGPQLPSGETKRAANQEIV